MTTDELALEPVVDPSGWFSVQLRYAYLVDDAPIMIEDRVVLATARTRRPPSGTPSRSPKNTRTTSRPMQASQA